MAEILCGVMSGSESSGEACERSSRVARRRRMEQRRFKIITGVAAEEGEVEETGRKKRRMDCCGPAGVDAVVGVLLPLDLNTAEEEVKVVPRSPGKEAEAEAAAETEVDRCPGYGMTSVCGRRREMEDAVSIRPEFLRRWRRSAPGCHFFGVFDGHGCFHVAVSCKDRMHEVVAEEVDSLGDAGGSETPGPAEWKNVMERSFYRVDSEMLSSRGGSGRDANCKCLVQSSKNDYVGSTAVAAVVSPDHVIVANCGDSRAVLCRRGVPIPLSSDHKPDRPDELQRIQAAGGRVIYWDGARVLGVLAMSRAIGDNLLKPFITSEPEVTVTERANDDESLILASDGLWDVVSNSTACEVVTMCLRGSTPGGGGGATEPLEEERDKQGGSDKVCVDAAILLTKLALARRSADNVSVVVVDLRRKKL